MFGFLMEPGSAARFVQKIYLLEGGKRQQAFVETDNAVAEISSFYLEGSF